MRHERHFTQRQASAALGWVTERLEVMRAAREHLLDPAARAAVAEAGPTNGGGQPGRVIGEGFLDLRRAAAELDAAGVVVRDLERGLCDFPSIRDGREVYLCWVESEEDEIGYWHDLDDGYPGRQPL
jgi:hypothetical protein